LRDPTAALAYLELAAAQGHPAAQERLQLQPSETGHSTPDYARLLDNYRVASEGGDPVADFNLGILYSGGLGTAVDTAKAQAHYLRAATTGMAVAQNNLAVMLLQSETQPGPDTLEQAAHWFGQAADQGFGLSLLNLAHIHLHQGQNPSAMVLLQEAAQQGLAKAQFNLGWHLAFGDTQGRSLTQALPWLHQAAEQGDCDALYTLGRMQFFGQGLNADAAQALAWYQRAAALGDCAAQFNLGSMYANAQGTPQDYVQALRWYQAAAGQAPAPALQNNAPKPLALPLDTPQALADADSEALLRRAA
jgi:TPR repeat protein